VALYLKCGYQAGFLAMPKSKSAPWRLRHSQSSNSGTSPGGMAGAPFDAADFFSHDQRMDGIAVLRVVLRVLSAIGERRLGSRP
jgi:hypothetical protein